MTFYFRWSLTIFTALALAILVSLGIWQLQRLDWKRDLVATVESRLDAEPIPYETALARQRAGEDMTYMPVTVTGRFDHGREVYVYGMVDGRPGWNVFTPLETGEGAIAVNRGLVPDERQDPATRPQGQVTGEVTVTGLFRTPQGDGGIAGMVSPAPDPAARQYFIRDPRNFGFETGYYIDSSGAENAAPAQWPRGGQTRIEFSNRHLEYAWTWFGLAAALLAVYLAFSIRRRAH